jgi:hypothetical protein
MYKSDDYIDGGSIGSSYLFDGWMEAEVQLKGVGKSLITEKMNCNLATREVEIYIEGEIRAIRESTISSFTLMDDQSRVFKSCNEYGEESLSGFFEVLYSGNIELLERSYIYIKAPTYNAALMIGEKKNEIIIKHEYYYYDSNEGKVSLIKKTKSLTPLLSEGAKRPKIEITREELITFFNKQKL